MSETRRYVTLRDYLRVLRRNWLLVALATAVLAGAGLAYSLRQDTVYETEASILFTEPTQALDVLGTSVTPTQTPEERAAEGAIAVTRPEVLARVRKRLDLGVPVDTLQGRVTALAEARTNFVVIQARAPSAPGAADLANEVAQQVQASEARAFRAELEQIARSQRRELERRREGDEDDPSGTDSLALEVALDRIAQVEALARVAEPVEIVSFAGPPASPAEPQTVRNSLLGGLLGLVLGVVVAFVRDALDRRLRSAREIEEHTGLPLIGTVGAKALGNTGFVVKGGFIARRRRRRSRFDLEAFRIMRANLGQLDEGRDLRSFAVTSGVRGEGKSTVAASLAYAFAVAGKRTLLLECDMRASSLAKRLSLEPEPGLTEILTGRATLEQATRTVEGDHSPRRGRRRSRRGRRAGAGEDRMSSFDCVPAGGPTPRAPELLGSKRFEVLLEDLAAEYDVILIDSSPLLPVADALEVVPHVDAVLVCVRSARTTHDEARAARAALENVPDRPTALVVTGMRRGEDGAYGQYSSSASA